MSKQTIKMYKLPVNCTKCPYVNYHSERANMLACEITGNAVGWDERPDTCPIEKVTKASDLPMYTLKISYYLGEGFKFKCNTLKVDKENANNLVLNKSFRSDIAVNKTCSILHNLRNDLICNDEVRLGITERISYVIHSVQITRYKRDYEPVRQVIELNGSRLDIEFYKEG